LRQRERCQGRGSLQFPQLGNDALSRPQRRDVDGQSLVELPREQPAAECDFKNIPAKVDKIVARVH
jgi:hypothetical protein